MARHTLDQPVTRIIDSCEPLNSGALTTDATMISDTLGEKLAWPTFTPKAWP
jgi:hypothetical protein